MWENSPGNANHSVGGSYVVTCSWWTIWNCMFNEFICMPNLAIPTYLNLQSCFNYCKMWKTSHFAITSISHLKASYGIIARTYHSLIMMAVVISKSLSFQANLTLKRSLSHYFASWNIGMFGVVKWCIVYDRGGQYLTLYMDWKFHDWTFSKLYAMM